MKKFKELNLNNRLDKLDGSIDKKLKGFKGILLSGLVAVIPAAFVLWLIKFFIDLGSWFGEWFGITLWYVGLVILFAAIFTIGIIVSNKYGAKLHALIARLIKLIPFIDQAYSFAEETTQVVVNQESFKKVVLVQPERLGVYKYGFITNEEENRIFIPTVPNPLSGNMIITDEYEIVDLTIPQAMKILSSLGAHK